VHEIGKEGVVAFSRYYLRICLEGLGESTKRLSQNSPLLGLDSNRAPRHREVWGMKLSLLSLVRTIEELLE
jgi:hypothetical protein